MSPAGEPSANPQPARAARRLRFGRFELDRLASELLREGTPLRLRPQAFEVLWLLAACAPRVASRDELRAAVWGRAGAAHSDQGLNHCIREIRAALGDAAGRPLWVETLPRLGYRFLAAVEAMPEAEAAPPPWARVVAPRRRSRAFAAAFAIARGLVAGSWSAWHGRSQSAPPTRLAALPLQNLTGIPERAELGAGIGDEPIAELLRQPSERLVVGGGPEATPARPAAGAGHEPPADYALEGSLREADERIRLTVRLVRLPELTQIWAASYDRERVDLLQAERDLAREIASRIRLTLAPAAQLPAERQASLDPEPGAARGQPGCAAQAASASPRGPSGDERAGSGAALPRRAR